MSEKIEKTRVSFDSGVVELVGSSTVPSAGTGSILAATPGCFEDDRWLGEDDQAVVSTGT